MRLSTYSVFALLSLHFLTNTARADIFDLTINYTGDAQYQGAFDNAEAIWEGLINEWQNGVVVNRSASSSFQIGQTINELTIDASVVPIDGAGGILGQAGPTEIAIDQLGFVLATDGIMEFDSADIDSLGANLELVIAHEMSHVMGFGTLWTQNNVYVTDSGEYTGAEATAAWQTEFGQAGTPDVELGGGPGTANGHWNEVDNGAGNTGITDDMGRDMRFEIMTGWANGPDFFISDMTLGSFVDIGFGLTAVPEPTSLSLILMASCFGIGVRRKRQSLEFKSDHRTR